jgi:hypothetical protein
VTFLDKQGVERLWVHILNKLTGKVDVETGKGLSTNDFTDIDKNKLNNIAESADAVSFTANLTSGEKIGTININGVDTEIFIPKTSTIYISTSEPESTASTGQDGDLWMVVEA